MARVAESLPAASLKTLSSGSALLQDGRQLYHERDKSVVSVDLRVPLIVPLIPPAESNTTQIYLQATPPRSRTRAHSLSRLEIYLTRII